MSLFERPEYQWRETYFVLFDKSKRPTVQQMEEALREANDSYELENMAGDDQGRFESVTVLARADYAALDISYLEGEEVTEEAERMVEEVTPLVSEREERRKLERATTCNARLDIMHFQQMLPAEDEEEEDEWFDPSTLLLSMEALSRLTGGIGVDPQSGTVM